MNVESKGDEVFYGLSRIKPLTEASYRKLIGICSTDAFRRHHVCKAAPSRGAS